jgi:multiple sugar transport system permease protein
MIASRAETRSSAIGYLVRNRPGYVASRVILYAIIIAGGIIYSIPFFWLLSTSVKTGGEVFVDPPKWIPSIWEWNNYVRPFQTVKFAQFYKNTIVFTGADIIGTVISSSLVAFGFSRMRFRGRDFLFLIVLSTMMLPTQVTLIPQYLLFTKLHMVNTLWPLIIPNWFGSPFNIFLLRQFMLTIPHEMDDAARMDGANWFQIYFRVMLPLIAPALGVIAIFSFTYHWNDLFYPLIYLNTQENFTVTLGLQLLNTRYTTDVPATMAMTVLSIIPCLAVFFFAQRHFIQGIVVSGIKG